MEVEKEVWVQVKGFSRFEVSNYSRLRMVDTKQIMRLVHGDAILVTGSIVVRVPMHRLHAISFADLRDSERREIMNEYFQLNLN